MTMPNEYILTLGDKELGRFDTRRSAEKEIDRHRAERQYPPDLDEYSITTGAKLMSSFRPKKKETAICLQCQKPFLSPDKTRIRRCTPCKNGKTARYDMTPVKESPNDD